MALASASGTRQAFLLGLTTGLVYFTGTLYWIALVMAVYGGLPMWIAASLNGALIAYLALFPALFAVVMRRAIAAFGAHALAAAPLAWVATELGRTYVLTGFPWVLVGYSQAAVLPIAQLASVVGVYGLSLFVAVLNTGFAVAATSMRRPRVMAIMFNATLIGAFATCVSAPYRR